MRDSCSTATLTITGFQPADAVGIGPQPAAKHQQSRPRFAVWSVLFGALIPPADFARGAIGIGGTATAIVDNPVYLDPANNSGGTGSVSLKLTNHFSGLASPSWCIGCLSLVLPNAKWAPSRAVEVADRLVALLEHDFSNHGPGIASPFVPYAPVTDPTQGSLLEALLTKPAHRLIGGPDADRIVERRSAMRTLAALRNPLAARSFHQPPSVADEKPPIAGRVNERSVRASMLTARIVTPGASDDPSVFEDLALDSPLLDGSGSIFGTLTGNYGLETL